VAGAAGAGFCQSLERSISTALKGSARTLAVSSCRPITRSAGAAGGEGRYAISNARTRRLGHRLAGVWLKEVGEREAEE